MIKGFEGLLARLGLKRDAGTRAFALDANLRSALVAQAEQEQRPTEELYADLLTTALAHRQTNAMLMDRWQTLSPRGQDVTALTCRGYTNRQIAARLGVSEETVKTHVKNALEKFKMHGKLEIQIALKEWDFSEWDK
jgi:DNA-binding CsgD family transcriptional regulator